LAPQTIQKNNNKSKYPKSNPKTTPISSQDGPRGSKRLPGEPQEAQKSLEEASNTSKRPPKNALETKKKLHQDSTKQNSAPIEIESNCTWPYIFFATMSVDTTSL